MSTLPDDVSAPDLEVEIPFTTPAHPDTAAIEAQVLAWAASSGLAADDRELAVFRAGRFGELAAWTMPRADVEHAVLVGQVITWLFAFDDRYLDQDGHRTRPAEVAALLVRCQQLLRPVPQWRPPAPPLEPDQARCLAALADLLGRLESADGAGQTHRFAGELSYALYGALLELSWHAEDTPVRADWYAVTRPMTSAALALLALVGLGTDSALRPDAWARPDVQQLTMHAAAFIGWTNDLFSWRKEMAHQLNDTNLLWLLAPRDRTDHARRICQDELDAYLRLEASIGGADPRLLAHTDGLRCCMYGNYQWSLRTPRYHA
ncbi:terpene synthase family protein [Amycolatopsis sacchari]|uniref:terpene synthase family protein n=1 Tax=Amycolatopsis sacchari TaxID=115433 RepID=UPI003D763868